MEKQIRNLLDTGSPLAIIKFLQELTNLGDCKTMSNLFSTNGVYCGSKTVGPMWICLQEKTMQKQINTFSKNRLDL